MGHKSDADVCPTSPCVAHIFLQVGRATVCVVARQDGQTRLLEQAESPLRWECWRQVVQYLGTMWMLRVFEVLGMMTWLMRVSCSRNDLAWDGVEKNTRIALGASMVVVVRCWIRWVLVISGWICFNLSMKSVQASARLCGYVSPQKRKRLSGRLRINMTDSSASRGGGRILSLNSVSLAWR